MTTILLVLYGLGWFLTWGLVMRYLLDSLGKSADVADEVLAGALGFLLGLAWPFMALGWAAGRTAAKWFR